MVNARIESYCSNIAIATAITSATALAATSISTTVARKFAVKDKIATPTAATISVASRSTTAIGSILKVMHLNS